jgi:hypothetical protein
VTGRFSQERRGIWELKVEGDAEPIGVTPHHPLWSLDRHAWVSASELRPYERLATLTGPARLMDAIDTHIADPVYNIEVEGENCYRVGETGTLVHNQSIPTRQDLIQAGRQYRENTNRTKGQRNLGGIIYVRRSDCAKLRITMNFPNSFLISDSTGHTEDQINQQLAADPAIANNPDTIEVLLLFTERDPCRTCLGTHIPALERKNGGPFTQQLVSFIPPGTVDGVKSEPRLAAFYGFARSQQENQ